MRSRWLTIFAGGVRVLWRSAAAAGAARLGTACDEHGTSGWKAEELQIADPGGAGAEQRAAAGRRRADDLADQRADERKVAEDRRR